MTFDEAVQGWVYNSARRIDEGVEMVDNHLDEISTEYDTGNAVDLGHRAFAVCLKELTRMNVSYMCRLVFPMDWSEQLVTQPPELNRMSDFVTIEEPPSLYIVKSPLTVYVPYFDEYRSVLHQERHVPELGEVVCFYTCQRFPDDETVPFQRMVWFDFLPNP